MRFSRKKLESPNARRAAHRVFSEKARNVPGRSELLACFRKADERGKDAILRMAEIESSLGIAEQAQARRPTPVVWME